MMLMALHFVGSTPNRPCTIEEVCMWCARGNLFKNVTSPLFLVDLETRKARLLSHNECFSVDLVELNKELDRRLTNPDLWDRTIHGLRAIVFDTLERDIVDVGGTFEAMLVVETDRVLLPELHCYSLEEIQSDSCCASYYPGYAFSDRSRLCCHPNVAVFDCELSADELPLVKVTEMSRSTEGAGEYCMMSSEPLSLTLPAFSDISKIGKLSCNREFINDLWNAIQERVATLIVILLRLSPRERGPVTSKLASDMEKTVRQSPYCRANASSRAIRTRSKRLRK